MPADFSAMLRQLKRNEAAKAARRDALFRKKKMLVYPNGYSKVKTFEFPEVSKKEMANIKTKIRRSIKKDQQKQSILLIVLSIATLTIILNSIDFTTPVEIQHQQELAQDNFLSENINEFSFLIDDGDQWIQKRRWNNAIYRFEQAVKLFPSSYEANYRLALAYSYSCQFKNDNCDLGEKLTTKLLKYHPDEINLINLKVTFEKHRKSR